MKGYDIALPLTDSADWDMIEIGSWIGLAAMTKSEITIKDVSWENLGQIPNVLIKLGITLEKKGDDLRIDWGYLNVATNGKNATTSISGYNDYLNAFNNKQPIVAKQQGTKMLLNTVFDLGKVAATPVDRMLMIGYDDIYSVQYFNQNLKAWWNNNNTSSLWTEFMAAARDYKKIMQQCDSANKRVYTDALKAGGEAYAKLAVLAYRQAIAAHKLLKSPSGEILFLSKENFSNGSINTVDVTYPSAPLFLMYNPDLLKGMMNGIFYF